MKTFRRLVSEVAQPVGGDEKNFKDKHLVQIIKHPVSDYKQHTGDIDGNGVEDIRKKNKRRADYKKGEDSLVYEANLELDDENLEQRLKRSRKAEIKQKVMESKLDKLGQEDDDIDNDGDVDSSDSYLHGRRKAITKAIRNKFHKESAKTDNDEEKPIRLKLRGFGPDHKKGNMGNPVARASALKNESIELDEKAVSQTQQKAAAMALAAKKGKISKSKLTGAAKDMLGMSVKDLEDFARTKLGGLPVKMYEETEHLDEISDELKRRYHEKGREDVYNRFTSRGKYEKPRNPDNFTKTGRPKKSALNSLESIKYREKIANRNSYLAKVKDYLMKKEEVEQIGELSKTSYTAQKGISKIREDLEEAMKLDKTNHVYHNQDSEKFAKDYVKGHKGDYTPGGPSEKHEKDSEKFHNTYKRVGGRSGFGGSGHDIYQHTSTGEKFRVDRQSNGKGFYGTDHRISKINEEVEQIDENGIKGWKHAGSDLAKARARKRAIERGEDPDANKRKSTKPKFDDFGKKEVLHSVKSKNTNIYTKAGDTHEFVKQGDDFWTVHHTSEVGARGVTRPKTYTYHLGSDRKEAAAQHNDHLRRSGFNLKPKTTANEEVELSEISDKLKAKYLDKAVQQRYDFFKEPWDPKKEPKWATPGGKPKKGYYDQPHKVKARKKDARRGEIIDKTAEKLTGKPHYGFGDGNAADWWKGKKYSTESVEQIDEVSGATESFELTENLGKVSKKMKFWFNTDPRDVKKRLQNADPAFVDDIVKRPEGKLGGPAELQRRLAVKMTKAKMKNEETDLTENFKAGAVKLNDGSSVTLKDQDAKLLNQLFKDLNAENKKKMMNVAMTDKHGFNEILGFAREAL